MIPKTKTCKSCGKVRIPTGKRAMDWPEGRDLCPKCLNRFHGATTKVSVKPRCAGCGRKHSTGRRCCKRCEAKGIKAPTLFGDPEEIPATTQRSIFDIDPDIEVAN